MTEIGIETATCFQTQQRMELGQELVDGQVVVDTLERPSPDAAEASSRVDGEALVVDGVESCHNPLLALEEEAPVGGPSKDGSTSNRQPCRQGHPPSAPCKKHTAAAFRRFQASSPRNTSRMFPHHDGPMPCHGDIGCSFLA